MASLLAPIIRIYQFILYPVAKPCALLLDSWLGKESVQFFSENNIKLFIKKHMEGFGNEIDDVEGKGAINFFSLDDNKVTEEGEDIIPESIIKLKSEAGKLIFPPYTVQLTDPFIHKINRSGEKWIILTDENNNPKLVLDADGFIRSEILSHSFEGIESYCHTPIVINDENTNLGELIKSLKSKTDTHSDLPIETDVVLFWTKDVKRIITGADIFGRLLKGI
jgi:hypothetical protein